MLIKNQITIVVLIVTLSGIGVLIFFLNKASSPSTPLPLTETEQQAVEVTTVSTLPRKTSTQPQTTNSIPHIQLSGFVETPDLAGELLERVATLSAIKLERTAVGRAGSTGFWVAEGVTLAHPEALIRGREFAHVHPDGSLHASLSPELAAEAVATGWVTYHPWASENENLRGFVMIYTPQSPEELDVVYELVKGSYNFITGRDE